MMDVWPGLHHLKKSLPLGYLSAFRLIFAINLRALLGKSGILFLILNLYSPFLSHLKNGFCTESAGNLRCGFCREMRVT